MGLWQRIRAQFSRFRRCSRILPHSARCDESGVTRYDWFGDREETRLIPWEEIDAVLAYKRDIWTYDMVCLLLLDVQGLVLVHLTEDSACFHVLIHDLPCHLDGCLKPEDWWDRVVLPPFKECRTELYRKLRPAAAQKG